MRRLAEVLGAGMTAVRVDFYQVDGRIYFGEFTFYHHDGLMPFEPDEWDYVFGEWIKLPKYSK